MKIKSYHWWYLSSAITFTLGLYICFFGLFPKDRETKEINRHNHYIKDLNTGDILKLEKKGGRNYYILSVNNSDWKNVVDNLDDQRILIENLIKEDIIRQKPGTSNLGLMITENDE